ncbi:MAG: S-methyl-5-thioribose-1-phosphate isomerase [Syntrophomonadaceae bacterium]|nr:S-methyl-5-thioribose-1-phosphate isomerase [Syntrophomonadaceae bacterium]
MIAPLIFTGPAVEILNQNRLPDEVVYEEYRTAEEIAEAIKELKVRGAPLIGIAAAFGLALAVNNYNGTLEQLEDYFNKCKNLLAATRPTAVNLFWALNKMEMVYRQHDQTDIRSLQAALITTAENILAEDISINKAIGSFGEELLKADSRVLTICNAGALATGGYGTALGVIKTARQKSKISQVWACETRPVLQGARLTVWELMQDEIPVTLITDSMAGYIMQLKLVDAVIAGADRIAANGDTANKIGTYTLAVLAYYHNIPFYIAAPHSTIDLSIERGSQIPIEERAHQEIRQLRGINLTVPEVKVFNPAFDVTPQQMIAGIITESGVIRPPYKENIEQHLALKR